MGGQRAESNNARPPRLPTGILFADIATGVVPVSELTKVTPAATKTGARC